VTAWRRLTWRTSSTSHGRPWTRSSPASTTPACRWRSALAHLRAPTRRDLLPRRDL